MAGEAAISISAAVAPTATIFFIRSSFVLDLPTVLVRRGQCRPAGAYRHRANCVYLPHRMGRVPRMKKRARPGTPYGRGGWRRIPQRGETDRADRETPPRPGPTGQEREGAGPASGYYR